MYNIYDVLTEWYNKVNKTTLSRHEIKLITLQAMYNK